MPSKAVQPSSGDAGEDRGSDRLAHLSAHRFNFVKGQRRGRQGGLGLLRHASAKITLDVYAQAVTPDKRRA
jgi:hypothetical protein